MYSNSIATVLISTVKLKCTSLSHTPSVFSGLKIHTPFEKNDRKGSIVTMLALHFKFRVSNAFTYTHQHDLIQC